MAEVVQFIIFGLGIGAVYALSAQGLIVIYRGSGVLNFAQGALGLVGAYVWWELQYRHGWAFAPAAILGVAAAAILGAAMHLLLMRPLRRASPLVRVVATLGVLILVQSIAVLRFKGTNLLATSELPTNTFKVGSALVSVDRLILLGIAALFTVALWYGYRKSHFGLATTAVAENQIAASAQGISPDKVAVANWMLGTGLAGVAAILLAPIVTLQIENTTSTLLIVMAAALVAGFRSFPIAALAALGLGIAEALGQRYVKISGFGASVPFLVIIIVVVIRGRALPLRDYFLQKLPSVGTGLIRPWLIISSGAAAVVILNLVPDVWVLSICTTISIGIILLSIVVLTGYAGQLSLAQFAFAGFGAWVAGRTMATLDFPFWLAFLAGVGATVPLGVLFALPAIRSRGINLAVVTLGLGSALALFIFNNSDLTGGFVGTQVFGISLFGFNIETLFHSTRYGIVNVVFFVLAGLVVANVRRGRSGRRLIAVRTNERAAAALGINVPLAKLYAFALSAAIAAAGGILLAFQTNALLFASFTSFQSISIVAWAVIGGVGYVIGGLLGATLAANALGTQITHSIFGGSSADAYVSLGGALILLVLIVGYQNGLAPVNVAMGNKVLDGIRRLTGFKRTPRRSEYTLDDIERIPVVERTLRVDGVSVRFGSTVAVDRATLTVSPGKVVGVIGPNGAGKTSLIDAVTGFTAAEGLVSLDGIDISDQSPAQRARSGLSRSFQSLELFDDSTVMDNIRAACDPNDLRSYLRDIVWPRQPKLPGDAVAVIKEFKLDDDLGTKAEDLSYGKRRLLAIARAVSRQPSVLFLDEPAAGLSETESAELGHAVRRLADDWNMGILVVEHDMSFVMNLCDEVVVLDFGRTIASGPPMTVRSDPGVIAAYLGEEDAGDEGQPVGPAGAALGNAEGAA